MVVLVLHGSCVKFENVRIKTDDPKLVLNAGLCPHQDIALHLSRSIGIGDTLQHMELKETATVHVYINELYKGTMLPVEPEEPAKEEPAKRLKGVYVLPGVKPVAGDKVRFEANVDGYETATAYVGIPEDPLLLSVDTVRYLKDRNELEQMRLYIKMQDRLNVRDYYRVILNRESIINGETYSFSYPLNASYYTNYYQYGYNPQSSFWMINYDDPAFMSDFSYHSPGMARDNYNGLFSDNLFRGKEYVLKLSFSEPINSFSSDTIDIEVKYHVKLFSVSENYYNYYKQNSQFFLSIAEIWLSPNSHYTTSYSNVKNGFGLVYAYHEKRYTIKMDYSTDKD